MGLFTDYNREGRLRATSFAVLICNVSSPLKKWKLQDFECHWLCQCRKIKGNSALAKPVAHFFNGNKLPPQRK
jgi:hypothetical protein